MLKKIIFSGVFLLSMTNVYGIELKDKCIKDKEICFKELDLLLEKKDYKESLKYLNVLIELNDTQSYSILGKMYFNGIEVEKNETKAMELFKKGLSLTKKIESYSKIGNFLISKQSYNNAIEIFKLGVEKNDQKSINMLAILHSNKIFGNLNFEKTIELLKLNYEKNKNLEAQKILANAYYEQGKYEQSIKESEKYFSLDKNDDENNFLLAYLYYKIPGFENKKRAIELLNLCKNTKNQCATNLGEMYYHGNGVEKNYNLAKELYLKGLLLNENDPDALNNLGLLYSNGHGVEKNNKIATDYWIKAISLGNRHARGNYLNLCENLLKDKIETEYCNKEVLTNILNKEIYDRYMNKEIYEKNMRNR